MMIEFENFRSRTSTLLQIDRPIWRSNDVGKTVNEQSRIPPSQLQRKFFPYPLENVIDWEKWSFKRFFRQKFKSSLQSINPFSFRQPRTNLFIGKDITEEKCIVEYASCH